MAARGSSAWRAEMWGKGCDTSVIIATPWIIGAGKIQVHRNAIRVFRAVGRIMRKHRYAVRSDVTGCYNCRPITGGTAPSAHAQGIALDVNWDTNPYRLDRLVTDMPAAMREEIEALRTDAGVQACRGGWDWDGRPETPHSNYDAMHIEVMCAPSEVRAGFSIPDFDVENNAEWPLLALNEKGDGVKQLQRELAVALDLPLAFDGYFGPITESVVRQYQTSRALSVDGVVGLGTWTALLSRQPRVVAGGFAPNKGQS